MGPGEKELEDLAEEIINEADSDISTDDLTRGTEVYEEVDDEVDGEFDDGDPQELDFEPAGSKSFNFDGISDGFVHEDDY